MFVKNCACLLIRQCGLAQIQRGRFKVKHRRVRSEDDALDPEDAAISPRKSDMPSRIAISNTTRLDFGNRKGGCSLHLDR